MPDGSIIFETKLDNSELAKELSKTKSKIIKEYDNIQAATARKNVAVEQIKQMEAEMLKLQNMAVDDGVNFNNSPENVARIGELQSKLAELRPTVEQYEKKIQDSNIDLDLAKEKAGLLEMELAKSANDADRLDKNTKKSSKAMQEMEKRTRHFGSRMREIVTGALFFNIISRGISGMVQWTGNMIKANDDARASIASLKGALLTLAQPILNVVIPAFVSLVNILTRVIAAIASVVSRLFGTTAQKSAEAAKSLNKQAGGYGGVAKKAKEATKSIMAFDELNTLQAEQDDDSSGGGGGGTGTIAPDFGLDFDDTEADLNRILQIAGAIGAALLGWKIASLFTDNLKTLTGVALTAAGGFVFLYNYVDAFANGISWDNLNGMVVGLGIALVGLGLAFGTVGVAVGLVVAGGALLVLGLKEWIQTGKLSDETFAALEIAILAVGAGLSMVLGLPALVAAAFIAGALAIYKNWESMPQWFKDIFNAIGDGLTAVCDWVVGALESLGGWVIGILQWIVDAVNSVFEFFGMGISLVSNGAGGMEFSRNAYEPAMASVPALARGAVIPPNREFLAVLGDQSHGTNIEAPLETIKQAVAEVMGSDHDLMREQNDLLRQILAKSGTYLDGKEVSSWLAPYQRDMNRARGW